MTEPITFARSFVLRRDRDISGVSGTGIVADGVVFPDGHAAIHWRGKWALTTPHPDGLESIIAIHDHGGRGDLHIVWADEQPECGQFILRWGDRTLGPCIRKSGHPEVFHRDPNGTEWRPTRPAPAVTVHLDNSEATFTPREDARLVTCQAACTATITSQTTNDTVRCAKRLDEHQPGYEDLHAGPTQSDGSRRCWNDSVAGATPHRDSDIGTLAAEVQRLGDWCRAVSERARTAEADRDRYHDELATNEADRVAAVHRAEQAGTALTEAQQVIGMQKDLIGAERRIVMTAMGHREDQGVRAESCDGCGQDHIAELEKEILAADQAYAEVFPATAEGPARPGRLPDSAHRTPRQRAYEATNAYVESLRGSLLATQSARTSHIWIAVNRALEAAGHAADPETQCGLPHEMEG